ncbi:MAG TPA: alpha/beta hydrolase, partial [Bradyrhizobium sp.]|nr:alpha/beta hydrolase [Bradyrhizobium sp.]
MPIRCLLATSLILSCLSVAPMKAAETVTSAVPGSRTTTYKTVAVNGLNIFYREAGPSNAPAILLLHG